MQKLSRPPFFQLIILLPPITPSPNPSMKRSLSLFPLHSFIPLTSPFLSFFAYCWAISHPELLGTTAERVVLTGDSAGANLVIAVTMLAIKVGIRVPDVIVPVYPGKERWKERGGSLVLIVFLLFNNSILPSFPTTSPFGEKNPLPCSVIKRHRSSLGDRCAFTVFILLFCRLRGV